MESLLKDKTIQEYPIGYDYNNEQDRFGDIARIWNQTYEPGSKEWVEYLEHQKANHVNFDPTFNIYAASRDLMRAPQRRLAPDLHDAAAVELLPEHARQPRLATSTTGPPRTNTTGRCSTSATCG